jgi:hypothetical protein
LTNNTCSRNQQALSSMLHCKYSARHHTRINVPLQCLGSEGSHKHHATLKNFWSIDLIVSLKWKEDSTDLSPVENTLDR